MEGREAGVAQDTCVQLFPAVIVHLKPNAILAISRPLVYDHSLLSSMTLLERLRGSIVLGISRLVRLAAVVAVPETPRKCLCPLSG